MLKFKVNTKKFDMQLEALIKGKIAKKLDEIGQNFLQMTYNLVASNAQTSSSGVGSPVLTGQFYNNHVVSINSHSNNIRHFDNLSRNNPLPFLALEAGVLATYNISKGDSAFIANNLDYAALIESGAGSPTKAPRGVYKIAAEMAIVSFKARVGK